MSGYGRQIFTAGALLWVASVSLGEEKKSLEDFQYDVAVEHVIVDVQALDKDGRFVAGLKQDDFEILEDGKKVKILSFEEQNLAPGAEQGSSAVGSAETGARPEVRRFILFVDLLNSGIPAIEAAKKALNRFVGEILRPDDQVMVVILAPDQRTLILQKFTNSKPALLRAIEALHGNGGRSVMPGNQEREIHGVLYDQGGRDDGKAADATALAQMLQAIQMATDMAKTAAAEEYRRHLLALDSVATVMEMIEQKGIQPGRKAVIYVSEGLAIRPGQALIDVINRRIDSYNTTTEVNPDPSQPQASRAFPVRVDKDLRSALEVTVGRLNRFGATLYTINAQGLYIDSQADPSRPSGNLSNADRQAQFFESQEVLSALAEDTSGLAFHGASNIDESLHKIEEDNRVRYFLSYEAPKHKKGKKSKFYKIEVRCKKSDVTIRARKGYLD